MSHCTRNILGLAAGGLLLVAASAEPAGAAQYVAARPANPSPKPPVRARPAPAAQYGVAARPGVASAQVRPTVNLPYNGTRPIGGDWWRIYPWSPYNAWRNPYWYPPYNSYYPFPPDGAYPYNPYPVPQPYPVPFPWGDLGSIRR